MKCRVRDTMNLIEAARKRYGTIEIQRNLKFIQMKWNYRKIRRISRMMQRLITTVQRIILRNKTIDSADGMYGYQKDAVRNLLSDLEVAFTKFSDKVS